MEDLAVCRTLFYFVLSEVSQEIVKFSNEDFVHEFVRLGLDGFQNNAKPVDAGFRNFADVRLLKRRFPTTVDLQFLMSRKFLPLPIPSCGFSSCPDGPGYIFICQAAHFLQGPG